MDTVVSFYKFKTLSDLPALKADILALAQAGELRGTVLLASEGINASVAGTESAVNTFLETLQNDPRIGSFSEEKKNPATLTTHRRLLVKIKKEIVTMRKENLVPQEDTGYFLSPETFKQWCDEGKQMILVDTRNDYEVALGKFKGALDPQTKSFGAFPEWVEKNLADRKDATIVTYCTGGIRCEKATAYMKQEGFTDVYQIKGGILQYFADLAKDGQAPHWEGECIVFDKRLAVTPDLNVTKKNLCFMCLCELTSENIVDQKLAAGFLCKTCFSDFTSKRLEREEEGRLRQELFRKKRAEHCQEVRRRWSAQEDDDFSSAL